MVETSCRKNSRIPKVDPQPILHSSILLIQLHSLLIPSSASSSSSPLSSNPLLSLPPLALSRQLWQQFSQQLHQNDPNPNTLQALLSSLQLTRLPSSGDLGTIFGILVDCCQRKRWWELLEGVLETAASILNNPEIVFNDLFIRFLLVNCSVRTALQNSEFELLCVLLRKFPLFFESTKPNLFASAINQTTHSLLNAPIEKQQIIADCFASYPTSLPSQPSSHRCRFLVSLNTGSATAAFLPLCSGGSTSSPSTHHFSAPFPPSSPFATRSYTQSAKYASCSTSSTVARSLGTNRSRRHSKRIPESLQSEAGIKRRSRVESGTVASIVTAGIRGMERRSGQAASVGFSPRKEKIAWHIWSSWIDSVYNEKSLLRGQQAECPEDAAMSMRNSTCLQHRRFEEGREESQEHCSN